MCSICDGATEDEVRQWFAATIEEYGWAIQAVEASPDNWAWQYTIGLVEHYGHPELVVAAGLSQDDQARLLHHVVDEIKDGRRFGPEDHLLVAGADVGFAEVHPWQVRERGLLNTWFDHYRAFPEFFPSLEALQVVLPARFFCEHTGPQPRLDLPEDGLSRSSGTSPARAAAARSTGVCSRPHRRPPDRRW